MTTHVAERPRIRLQPAPACDPPFDDERSPQAWAALAAQPLLEAPTVPRPRQPRPPTGTPTGRTTEPPQVGTSAQTRAAASRFMNTCLEVLNGYRPVAHLRALSDPLAAATVLDAMTRALRRVTAVTRGSTCRVTLRRMRVCEPRPGVAEISAVLATRRDGRPAAGSAEGDRCWAAAFRLERRNGAWQCHVAHLL